MECRGGDEPRLNPCKAHRPKYRQKARRPTRCRAIQPAPPSNANPIDHSGWGQCGECCLRRGPGAAGWNLGQPVQYRPTQASARFFRPVQHRHPECVVHSAGSATGKPIAQHCLVPTPGPNQSRAGQIQAQAWPATRPADQSHGLPCLRCLTARHRRALKYCGCLHEPPKAGGFAPVPTSFPSVAGGWLSVFQSTKLASCAAPAGLQKPWFARCSSRAKNCANRHWPGPWRVQTARCPCRHTPFGPPQCAPGTSGFCHPTASQNPRPSIHSRARGLAALCR